MKKILFHPIKHKLQLYLLLLFSLCSLILSHFAFGATLNLTAKWANDASPHMMEYRLYRTDIARTLIRTTPYPDTSYGPFPVTVPDGSAGTLTFVLTAVNTYNLESADSNPASYSYNLTPLTVSLSIGSFLTPHKVSIICTATGGSGVTGYMVKQSPTPPPKSSLNWKAISPTVFTFPSTSTTGPQTLYAFAKDKAGNVSTAGSASVNLDVTKPTVTAFNARATSPVSGTVAISITATDPVVNGVSSGVAAYMVTRSNLTPPAPSSPKWMSGPTAPTSVTFSTTVKAGAILYAWAKDANGNVSRPKSARVTATAAVVATQAQATAPATQPSATMSGMSQPAMTGTPAGMMVWIEQWFKISLKNQGFYMDKAGLSSDRQSVAGYLKIWDWDTVNEVFQADLYLHDVQTDQWSSETLTLHYISGSELDFKVWSQVTGDLTYGFTARIQGNETSGAVTSGTFKTLGGYHIQENTDASTTQAGWLSITGKMVSESEVQVPADMLLH
jgi:hypothetical protein